MAVLADFFDETGAPPPAEQKLREAAEKGECAVIADARPDENGETADNRVRADFLCYLALGGCDACRPHDRGARLKGAWIAGPIDLTACRLRSRLTALDCWFDGPILIAEATSPSLTLDGSRLAGQDESGRCLYANGAKILGGLYLRDGFQASGETSLHGVEIDGNFECENGAFENPDGVAIIASALKVKGSVFLRRGFRAVGSVLLHGADISGDLECDGGRFRNPQGYALHLGGSRVAGRFFMRRPPVVDDAPGPMFEGRLALTGAHVAVLDDHETCWPSREANRGGILLTGFTYGGIPLSRTDWRTRMRWLERQPETVRGEGFRPQPWEQLQKVLTEQGRIHDAKMIGVAKEWRLTKTLPRITRPFHYLHGWFVGFGYFTARAAWLSLAFILLGMVVFAYAWRVGVMTPAEEVVRDDPLWERYVDLERPGEAWLESAPGRDYPVFDAFFYSFDVFIPVVSIELEPAWAPSGARGPEFLGAPVGRWIAYYRLVHEIFGYVLTGFIVLGAARLVRERGK